MDALRHPHARFVRLHSALVLLAVVLVSVRGQLVQVQGANLPVEWLSVAVRPVPNGLPMVVCLFSSAAGTIGGSLTSLSTATLRRAGIRLMIS